MLDGSIPKNSSPHHSLGSYVKRIFLLYELRCLVLVIHQSLTFSFCVPPSLNKASTGILTCCPSTTPFRPRLRVRLTLGGRTFPRKPWISVTGILTRFFVTYVCMVTSMRSTCCFHQASLLHRTLSYPQQAGSRLRLMGFSPDHFRRRITRPVSYYALFKWWLPLSQHPDCPSNSTSLIPLSPS